MTRVPRRRSRLAAVTSSASAGARTVADAHAGVHGAVDRRVEAVRRVVPAGGDVRAAAGGARLPAERRLGLGATEIAFAALRSGAIDVYPEYTGTGLLAILHERADAPIARAVYAQVAREFRDAVRRALAAAARLPEHLRDRGPPRDRRRGCTSARSSDLARVGPTLRAGLTPDFIGRADGLPGSRRAYGLRFREVRAAARRP